MGLVNDWPARRRLSAGSIFPGQWNGMLGFGGGAPAGTASGSGQPSLRPSAMGSTTQPEPPALEDPLPGDGSAGSDGQLFQLVSDTNQPAAPAPDVPRRAASARSRGSAITPQLSAEQIGNIVFNETQGLSGDNVPLARLQLAQSIINADTRWGANRSGHAKTAPTTLPSHLDARQRQILQDVYGSVAQALALKASGIDTSNGATNYNMRPTADRGPPYYGRSFTLESQWGPFQTSGTSNRYVDLYQNPDARRRR